MHEYSRDVFTFRLGARKAKVSGEKKMAPVLLLKVCWPVRRKVLSILLTKRHVINKRKYMISFLTFSTFFFILHGETLKTTK